MAQKHHPKASKPRRAARRSASRATCARALASRGQPSCARHSEEPPSNHPAAGHDTEEQRRCWTKSAKRSRKAESCERQLQRAAVGQNRDNGFGGKALEPRLAARFERVHARVLAELPCFATQGAVIASWRTYGDRRLGPYFRIVYRENGRQRNIYLGGSAALAQRVRELLATLQRPNHELRAMRRLTANTRAEMRRTKAQLRQHLASVGITLKGWEFRGSRRFLQSRRQLQAVLGVLAAAQSSGELGAVGEARAK